MTLLQRLSVSTMSNELRHALAALPNLLALQVKYGSALWLAWYLFDACIHCASHNLLFQYASTDQPQQGNASCPAQFDVEVLSWEDPLPVNLTQMAILQPGYFYQGSFSGFEVASPLFCFTSAVSRVETQHSPTSMIS